MFEIIKPGTQIRFLNYRNIFLTLSGILSIICLASIFIQGFNYGIEFKGGLVMQVKFDKTINTETIRTALKPLGMDAAIIQSVGAATDNEFIIRLATPSGKGEFSNTLVNDIEASLNKAAGGKIEVRKVDMVGAAVSKDIKNKGLISLIISSILVLIYIWFRFEFRNGIGAIVATLHDVILTCGIFSIFQLEVDLTFIAAILTIVGYSTNDTVVIFDRIRENIRGKEIDTKQEMMDAMNSSISQTLSRTILTVFTVLLASLSLFFLGGAVIHNFALAMICGLIFGTYSSIFIASPIVLILHKYKK